MTRLAAAQRTLAAAAALGLAALSPAQAQVQITEWLYNTSEFIEFTNLGSTAVDFSGWSFDDDSRVAGTVSLSGFGLVAAGESVILSQASAADFRAAWGLGAGVKVIGNNTTNLGRADEINLFGGSGQLVDRLTYGDQALGTVRTDTRSGTPASLSGLGETVPTSWVLSTAGDTFGSRLSADGGIGNPGLFTLAAAVPEPSSYALLIAGLAVVGGLARRRRAAK